MMLQEVQVLLSDLSSMHVTFCYREANGVANLLAKHAAVSQDGFVLHSAAPDFCYQLCLRIREER
ncbi:hypothetical protein RHGRI_037276 [Rhododendron griersonianum]|uniref:RNase H type-1 domain-containing protein n=1 Tax=Rhododendron griersonianum TaxID=479676 RepID=A0AAV6HS85_9ERIC|nr:hypothetical protein RHGRI_037276 [Rhododendron griersonianum]